MTVDDRIVALKFDNAGFEQKIGETLANLDKLNKGLDLSNSTHGMESLSAASKNVDLSPMGSAVDGIGLKFLGLATIGIAAIASLTSKAVNAGINIAKAFTIAPALQGFDEYETNLNAIQTTLANTASKGTNLDDVNRALQELNLYSDKTIYNFSEMAKNIGTFTAAGVDLDRATASIKGIANLAALSGSNAMQASTAMYQLSQAIAAGSVKIIDWNSVVTAGMGGEVFKTALFETGKALGTLKNVPMDQTFAEWEKANGSFRSSLSDSGDEVDSVASKVAKATKDANKQVASARKAQTDSAERGAESIKRAEESKAKAFENATKSINSAVDSQKRAIESAAKNNKDAIDAVTAAQERLKEAMKPTDVEDMQAATDNLTSAQLDQKDLAVSIAEAEKNQKKATDNLAKAKASAAKAKTPAQSKTGARRIADAEAKLLELTDALTRARIQQNSGVRSLHDAEETLTEAKTKGSEADKNVIDARENLAKAEKNALQIKAEGIKSELDAATNLKDVEIQAAESRKDSIKSLSDARKQAAESDISASERVADAVESAAERIKAANKDSGGGPKPGWLTDKVLTQTLAAFTGDLTKKQLIEKGYTEKQADELLKVAKLAGDAAVVVKTFKQLRGTVKESIGSGWAQTSELIVGDFEESKKLWTGVNDAIGDVVKKSTKARNDILIDWKKLGGRDLLIQGFKNAIGDIGAILRPIKEAFREIFPRKTATQLRDMSQGFLHLTLILKPSFETINNLKRTFKGLFALLEIGWTIIKGIGSVIFSFIGSLSGAGGGALRFTGNIGDLLVKLNDMLVTGGGIKRFFEKISEWVQVPGKYIQQFIDKIKDLFSSFKESAGAEESIGRVTSRLDGLRNLFEKFTTIPPGLSKFFDTISRIFDKVWATIKQWFSELGKKLADSMKPGDFDAAVDVVNVGLLGGIIIMLKRFSSGFKNFGKNGIFKEIGQSLSALTGKLKDMQANVKADTLMKIATAVGILTVSLLVLSLIDSDKLAKALTAMAAGFGELVGTMAILDKIGDGAKGAAKLGILVGAMIGMATAMVILSVAIVILSKLDPAELAKGLGAIYAGLMIMITVMQLISTNSDGLLVASVAIAAMSASLLVLSGVIKIFSTMSWTELAKGLSAMAVALGIMVGTMWLMSTNADGILIGSMAIVAMSGSLLILAGVIKIFSTMSWTELAKGLGAVAVALAIMVGTMWLMSSNAKGLIAGSVAMVAMSVALGLISAVVIALGNMGLDTLLKGIGGLAAIMLILAVSLNAMDEAMPGALALIVASNALLILGMVLKQLGSMSIKELAVGLAAMAGIFIVLGLGASLLSPIIPILLSLGVAMTLIGVAFLLFGAGAYLAAKAFEAIAHAGKTGIQAIIESIKLLLKALPEFAVAFVKSLIDSTAELVKAAPMLLRLITVLLLQILDTVIKLVPKIAEALGTIVSAGLKLIRDKFPEVLDTGFQLLMTFLRGIRDHIGEITTMGVDIMVNFAQALTDNTSRLVDAAVGLLLAFLKAFEDHVDQIIDAGAKLLGHIIVGIATNISKIMDIVTTIITTLTTEMGKHAGEIIDSGAEALKKFLEGLGKNVTDIITAGKNLVLKILEGMADNTIDFTSKLFILVTNLLNGLAEVVRTRSKELTDAGINLAKAIGEGFVKGLEQVPILGDVVKLGEGAVAAFKKVFKVDSPSKVFMDIGKHVVEGLAIGLDNDMAKNTAVVQAERIVSAFHKSLSTVPDALAGMGDLNPVITPVLDLTKVQLASKDLNNLMSVSAITPDVSYGQARLISTTSELTASASDTPVYTGPTEVTFEQNIFAPTALSTNDIYRNTKSQIVLAKEELGIS